MEPLSLSNKLFFIEWGTYLLIGALPALLYLYFSRNAKSNVKMTDFLRSYGKRVPIRLLLSLIIFFLLLLFVLFLLFRNERTPTMESVLPVFLLLSPSVILLVSHILETSHGGEP